MVIARFCPNVKASSVDHETPIGERASDRAEETRNPMKLYYSPGACSLHPQIALREADVPFDLVRVNLGAHKLADGTDYYGINPKGYVPTLELDDGTRLTEGAVIDQYIADRNPSAKLLPPAGTIERLRVQEWLHFIGTEVHKQFSPLFNPQLPDEQREGQKRKIAGRFDFIVKQLGDKAYLTGETFTVADGYLFNMLRWTAGTGIDLARWPTLKAYFERIGERPSVKAALEAERTKS
jgi:glutathione S-transferase